MSGVALVQLSSLDLSTFLPIGRKVLDRSLSEKPDNAGLNPPLNHMLCVASIKSKDIKANAAACKPYLNLFHAGFLIASYDRDLPEILEIAGLPSVTTESVERSLMLTFISGSLSQWRDALLRGCQNEVSRGVRDIYNSVYREFKRIGIGPAFDFNQFENKKDRTFLLENKS